MTYFNKYVYIYGIIYSIYIKYYYDVYIKHNYISISGLLYRIKTEVRSANVNIPSYNDITSTAISKPAWHSLTKVFTCVCIYDNYQQGYQQGYQR